PPAEDATVAVAGRDRRAFPLRTGGNRRRGSTELGRQDALLGSPIRRLSSDRRVRPHGINPVTVTAPLPRLKDDGAHIGHRLLAGRETLPRGRCPCCD